jgi:hypothetical protein
MKKLLLFISLFIFMINANGQNLIVDKEIVLKPGIYRNFEEFKSNKPSSGFNYSLEEDDVKYGNFISGAGKVTFYKLKVDKKKAKTIGAIYGFCDGKSVYVAPSMPTVTPKTGFSKLTYLGRYCYYEDIDAKRVISGPGAASTSINLEESAIDINTGKVWRLNKFTMRDILEKDAALLADFNNEKKKNKSLKDYLVSYSDKHANEITK